MKPAPFTYHAPGSLEEAVSLLHDLGPAAKVIAGGQSLVPVLNMRLATPEHLVDLTRLPGLDRIEVTAEDVLVGPLVTHRALERDDAAHAAQPLLRRALGNVGHPAVRARGTTVGSLAHADPNGEMPMVLALTGGRVLARSVRGERTIPAGELFVGPLETCLAHDEILAEAAFGRLPDGARAGFTEYARRSGDYAVAGVGLVLEVADEVLTGARAGFVSVTDVPCVLVLDDVVAGTPLAEADRVAAEVVSRVEAFVDPEGDIHATAEYRRHLTGVLTRRLLTALATAGRERATA
ncbi:MAG: FAD binding domain-containing protein [Actinomycetota bacterium]